MDGSQIVSFINRLEKEKVIMHSLLISHREDLIFEGYYSPIEKDELQRMFSVTKSFVAICCGLLLEDGQIELDDPIINYFPEKCVEPVHPYIASMTIRDCLMMRTCYRKTTYDKFDFSSDWVGSYFTSTPDHKPGTVFNYDTSAAHVLGALVEKLSGMKLLDYLRFRLPELNLSDESYILEGPLDVSMGGTGLVATPMDLLKFGRLMLGRGSYMGKQLISSDYIDLISSNLSSTVAFAKNRFEAHGYGMQFWRTPGGFCSYGMGGQLIMIYPDKELIIVTTADTQGNKPALQSLFDACEDFYRGFDCHDKTLPAVDLRITPLTTVSNRSISFRSDASGDIFKNIELYSDNIGGSFRYTLRGETQVIPFAFSELTVMSFSNLKVKAASSCAWISENEFLIYLHILDYLKSSVRFRFLFEENRTLLELSTTDETEFRDYKAQLVL